MNLDCVGELASLDNTATAINYVSLMEEVMLPTVRVVYPETEFLQVHYVQDNARIHTCYYGVAEELGVGERGGCRGCGGRWWPRWRRCGAAGPSDPRWVHAIRPTAPAHRSTLPVLPDRLSSTCLNLTLFQNLNGDFEFSAAAIVTFGLPVLPVQSHSDRHVCINLTF
ncbi:hypothetical protein ACJJTC_012459 [Scirpophaga incertulas]